MDPLRRDPFIPPSHPPKGRLRQGSSHWFKAQGLLFQMAVLWSRLCLIHRLHSIREGLPLIFTSRISMALLSGKSFSDPLTHPTGVHKLVLRRVLSSGPEDLPPLIYVQTQRFFGFYDQAFAWFGSQFGTAFHVPELMTVQQVSDPEGGTYVLP